MPLRVIRTLKGEIKEIKGPGEWIKDHLLEVGKDYPGRMHRLYNDYLKREWVPFVEHRGGKAKLSTYRAFRNYCWLYRRLGLLEDAGEEVPEARGSVLFQEVDGRLKAFNPETGKEVPFSPRRLVRLTEKGKAETLLWRKLSQARKALT